MDDPTAPVLAQAATLPPNMEGRRELSSQASNQETAAPQSSPRNAWCDGCDEPITGTRHKCQDCQDFDYCSRCILEASLIHPGHSFKMVGKQTLLEADHKRANGDGATAIDLAPETLGMKLGGEGANNHAARQAQRSDPGSILRGSDDSDHEPTSTPVESDVKEMASNGLFECRSCEPVTSSLPVFGAIMRHKSILEQNGGVPPTDMRLQWSIRISRLIEATQKGCAFCTLVLDNFFGRFNIVTHSFTPEKPWHSEPRKHDKERMSLVEHCMKSLTQLQHDHFGFAAKPLCRRVGSALPDFDALEIGVSDLKGRKQKDVAKFFNLWALKVDVYALKGDPAAAFISHRPPNPSPGSEDGLAQAKAWLDACVQNHGPSCGAQETPVLPTRVMDVSKPTLRLYETSAGETGNYAALSYCWGGVQAYQCTTGTLPALLAGFPFDDLPQTLKDAVTVTRSLGLKYLWIDSLCIIQDSETDKAHEVGRMAQVYRNAYVTVGAGSAFSVNDGFLTDKADAITKLWPSLLPMLYRIPDMEAAAEAETTKDMFRLPRVATGTLYLIREGGAERDWEDTTSRRAWCLQELAISPRFLSYGRWPTWRCRRATRSDGGYYLEHPKTGPSVRKLTNALLRSAKSRADLLTTVQLHNAWGKLLHDYTRRKLSLSSDRLPAIGGVAEQMSHLTGVGYVAGLWRNNLLHDVMFYAPTREWLARPAGNRAPTWSWASVEAPIDLGRIEADAVPLATVHACEAVPALGHTAFGEVAGGTMEIGGPFKEVGREDVISLFRNQDFWKPPPKSNVVSEWYSQLLQEITDHPERGVGIEEAAEKLPERVFALLTFANDWRMVHETRREEMCYSGLLLREVEGGKYERIGAFLNEVTGWLDHEREPWEEKTVIVV
ncbi:hypothetical protein RB595_002189 [Gaeumannomyces hyphopodioides]